MKKTMKLTVEKTEKRWCVTASSIKYYFADITNCMLFAKSMLSTTSIKKEVKK